MNIAIITTFPTASWEIYSKQAMTSWAANLPADIPVLVKLDDDLLGAQLDKTLRPIDQIAAGWMEDHKAFIERNRAKESPTDYRKQPIRFCHKVFAIKEAMESLPIQQKAGGKGARYLIWLDADVVLNRPITIDEIKACLPKDGDAVSYLGRKDWPHSECGWLAFDLEKGGIDVINFMYNAYVKDLIFTLEQWHDSWVFDRIFQEKPELKRTNLTDGKPGMDIWPHSPMGKWSTHYKGPAAKADLMKAPNSPQRATSGNIIIETKNALPHEEIREHIRINQMLIKQWVHPCHENKEELVVVSAGPLLIAEDVREEVKKGKKIVAVKNAIEPLKKAGITPWACILLDPRPHVADFVVNPDKDVIWFVASQVDPEVTKRLLEAGCNVWGYHAMVGADEEHLISKQENAIIIGGSATATRGLFLLSHMGFKSFDLYGYDLCYPDKQDLDARDKYNQPKYLEVSIGFTHPYCNLKRNFYTEPQLVAQFEELNEIIRSKRFNLKAYGQGIIPFLLKAKETGELREREIKAKLKTQKLSSYSELLGCSSRKKTRLSTKLHKRLWPSLLKQRKSSNSLRA